jgi:hypothetical protein
VVEHPQGGAGVSSTTTVRRIDSNPAAPISIS